MAGNKHFKALEKRLAQLGYAQIGTSGSRGSMWVFGHDNGHEITVNPGLAENACRQIIRTLDRMHGQAKKAPKRDVAAIKERQAEGRRLLHEEASRLEAERLRILRDRDSLLNGAASHLSNAEIRAIEQRVAETQRREKELVSLMTARPSAGSRVKHRSGDR